MSRSAMSMVSGSFWSSTLASREEGFEKGDVVAGIHGLGVGDGVGGGVEAVGRRRGRPLLDGEWRRGRSRGMPGLEAVGKGGRSMGFGGVVGPALTIKFPPFWAIKRLVYT